MQKLSQKLDMDDLAVEAIELGRQVADRARSVYLCKTRSNIGPRKRLRFAVVAE